MDNSELKTYLFSYHYRGAWYSLEIPACSEEEAKDRLIAVAKAQYDGELMYSIPAYLPGAGIFARLVTWFKNL